MSRPLHRRIAVDGAGQVVDELDDQLGQMVGRRGFSGEEECARRHLEFGILAQPVVEHHDAQRIQQLPFVFVNALDLAIENGVRVDGHGRWSISANRQTEFGLALAPSETRRGKPASSASGFRFCEVWPRSVIQPSPMASVIAAASAGFAEQQPAARRDAVGLVVEALREHLRQVLDRGLAQSSE